MADERILVVDDDRFMRELVSESLAESGYEAIAAETGTDALHKLSLHEFNLAIIDLSLEDMNGLELVDAILDGSPDTQIIIITGYPSLQSAIDALRRGAQDYIIKPFKLPEMEAAVTRGLRSQKLESEVRELRHKVRDQEAELLRAKSGNRPQTGGPRPTGASRPPGLPGAYGAPRPAQSPPPEDTAQRPGSELDAEQGLEGGG